MRALSSCFHILKYADAAVIEIFQLLADGFKAFSKKVQDGESCAVFEKGNIGRNELYKYFCILILCISYS